MGGWTEWKGMVWVFGSLGAVCLIAAVIAGLWDWSQAKTAEDRWLAQTKEQAQEACATRWDPFTPLPPLTPATLGQHRLHTFCLIYGKVAQ